MKTFIFISNFDVLIVLEYTYLLKAPELVSVHENDITIKINFEPDNINSKNGHTDLSHYQILYKVPSPFFFNLIILSI